ncbi:MAG: hypothetical protein ABJQ26_07485, partial [Maricaulis sp.]|uniref:hypothetical protein n=1 Tax=Maricaulis sp. TaxID=1486257 RepID=UPI003298E05D
CDEKDMVHTPLDRTAPPDWQARQQGGPARTFRVATKRPTLTYEIHLILHFCMATLVKRPL